MFALLGIPSLGRAQTALTPGQTTITWSANCQQAQSFVNNTGNDVCDLKVFRLVAGGKFPPPNYVAITVSGKTATWHVDQNHDGQLGASENDNTNGAFMWDATSYTRTQALSANPPTPTLADCIPANTGFTVQLCGGSDPNSDAGAVQVTGETIKLQPSNINRVDLVACCIPNGCLPAEDQATCLAQGGTPSDIVCAGCGAAVSAPASPLWTELVLAAGMLIGGIWALRRPFGWSVAR
jgi:hypothetical protein